MKKYKFFVSYDDYNCANCANCANCGCPSLGYYCDGCNTAR